MVDCNNAIARYANRRDHRKAYEVFQRLQQAKAENSYSYSNMINAYVQCGEVASATMLFQELRHHPRLKLDIVSCTALLKGYSKIGDIQRSVELMKIMKDAKPQVVPNVRTLNTFLRGCVVAGAVQEAETHFSEASKVFKISPDVSSWEYLVILLSHSLQVGRIQSLLGRLKGDESLLSGLGLMHVCLCRALAVLGDVKNCKRYLKQAIHFIDQFDNVEKTPVSDETEERTVKGGKRAWKLDNNESRENSLQVGTACLT